MSIDAGAPNVGPAAAPQAPGPREPSETFHLRGADDVELYGEWFAAGGHPRAAALIVHGYGEHCGRYREVAHVLTGSDLDVLSFDLRGHGRSEGQRGHINRFADYLDDLDAALAALRQRLRGAPGGRRTPLLLVAHSNGGLVALRALADPSRAPRHVAAAVLSAPFCRLRARIPPPKAVLARVAQVVAPWLSLPSGVRLEDLTHDRQKLRERRDDTLCHEVATARWFIEALRTQVYVAEMAPRIQVPTLWLVPDDDLIVDSAATRRVHARMRAPSRLVSFPGMYHELFNEIDRDAVFARVREFVNDQFPVQ